MAKTLNVYLHRELVGHLVQNAGGQMVFDYAESWLEKPGATPLSHSLPLRQKRFTRKECRGYFAGVLPEESKRAIIARNLGISERNDYAMLERIGGECAGAVTFLPAGEILPARDDHYRALSSLELAGILRELPRRPLLAGETGMRLSLAGAQDKIAVRVEGDTVSLPLGGAPSTHILKPAMERFSGVVSLRRRACPQLRRRSGAWKKLNTCWLSVTTGRAAKTQKARQCWNACTRKTFAKHWASSQKTSIRRKAARRSSSVLPCCARFPARRSLTWHVCWMP